MTTDRERLQERAQRSFEQLAAAREDPRFLRVMGGLVGFGVLQTNYDVPVREQPLDLLDALWAGEYEPRVLEPLPAILIRMPAVFGETAETMPQHLQIVVRALEHRMTPPDFRRIPGVKLRAWLDFLPTRT